MVIFRAEDLGFRVEGLGFRAEGLQRLQGRDKDL